MASICVTTSKPRTFRFLCPLGPLAAVSVTVVILQLLPPLSLPPLQCCYPECLPGTPPRHLSRPSDGSDRRLCFYWYQDPKVFQFLHYCIHSLELRLLFRLHCQSTLLLLCLCCFCFFLSITNTTKTKTRQRGTIQGKCGMG